MKIMVLGSGGREHALAWKIRQSTRCEELFIAPGNGGTGQVGKNIPLDIKDFEKVKQALLTHQIDLLVIGPEDPLVHGLVDKLQTCEELSDLLIVGPPAAGARLEGSKKFAKDFMYRYGIPTAKAKSFTKDTFTEGLKFLEETEGPYVLKADGLAAGKGVIITKDLGEAKKSLEDLLVHARFGDASAEVLIEQFLDGIELSVFVLTDGEDFILLPEAKDYKRIGDGDTGPNTGGMGAVSPVSFASREFMKKVMSRIVQPTIAGLKEDGIPYSGFIFFGLINVKNDPYVIEYNVRLGDPETQAVLPRVKSDLVDLLEATAKGKLGEMTVVFEPYTAVTVVLVSEGYPGSYEKGRKISTSNQSKAVIPFHAGTAMKKGELVTNGGRVIAVTSLGKNLDEAMTKSYDGLKNFQWRGMKHRSDIGLDLRNFSTDSWTR